LLSITKTITRLTTKLQTWSVNREIFIRAVTQRLISIAPITDEEMQNIWDESGVSLTRGERPWRVKNGTVNMQKQLLCYILPRFLSVLSVAMKVLHEAIRVVNFVPEDVVIVGFHENIERRSVINIAVKDEAEYFANGILVSNCHALLYATVGIQRYGGEPARIVGDDALAQLPKARIVEAEGVQSIAAEYSAGAFSVDNRVDL
jgi:hypothetical protein